MQLLSSQVKKSLDFLECDDRLSPALIKADEVEKAVNYVVRKWRQMNNKNIGLIRKVCAMAFSPKGRDLLEFLNLTLKNMGSPIRNNTRKAATRTGQRLALTYSDKLPEVLKSAMGMG